MGVDGAESKLYLHPAGIRFLPGTPFPGRKTIHGQALDFPAQRARTSPNGSNISKWRPNSAIPNRERRLVKVPALARPARH